jgi:catechol 2,3-dioxygenase-like lactoylglutathione lyase family enzyme
MILRVARHTEDLQKMQRFYEHILGLAIVGNFSDHDGYDGIMLGIAGQPWHLEFTSTPGDSSTHSAVAGEEDFLVFYPTSMDAYQEILDKIAAEKLPTYIPKNPFWQAHAIMIKDPDGFSILISGLHLPNEA